MKTKTLKILVTGSKGQVGQELQVVSKKYPAFNFTYVDVEELDITNSQAIDEFFSEKKYDYCLNCAAFTAVDKAETEHQTAWRVNAQAVQFLGGACQKHGTKIVQLSTDYVYHNNSQNTPFIEIDPTSPKGIYATSKLAGDQHALTSGGMVIRTSWVYSSFGNNFVKTMLRLGREREELGIIYDQIGTPTYARDLAKAILDIIQMFENQEVDPAKFNKIYHYSNEGVCSWYDFAKAVFDLKKIEVKVKPIETKEYPTPAERPPFSLLNKAKIKKTFGLEIPYWRESLVDCLGLLE